MTTRIRALAVGVFACLVLAVYFYTDDVHVTTPSGEHLCGNAYDVALFKKNGFVGGEMPPDQDAIDRLCVAKAKKLVVVAAGAGVVGVLALAPLGVALLRGRGVARHGEGPVHVPLR